MQAKLSRLSVHHTHGFSLGTKLNHISLRDTTSTCILIRISQRDTTSTRSCQWMWMEVMCVRKWIWLLPFSILLGQLGDARDTWKPCIENKMHQGPWIIMYYRVPLLTHMKYAMMRKETLNLLADQDFAIYLLKQVALSQPYLYTQGTRSCNFPRVMRLVSD